MKIIKKRFAEASTWLGVLSILLVAARVKYPEYSEGIDYALATIGATGIATPDTQHPVQSYQ